MDKRKERCETCRFWVRMPRESNFREFGECRAHPKKFSAHGDCYATIEYTPQVWCYPVQMIDDWCGEWQAVRESDAKPS